MKTVKLKIRKGISLLLRGYFRVYLFRLLCRKDGATTE